MASNRRLVEQPVEAAAPTTSILEKCAIDVARDVVPEEEELLEGERGSIWAVLLPLIMTVIQTVLQNCPMPASDKKRSMKRPTMRQSAAVLKITKENCDCCNMTRFTGRIHRSLMARATTLSAADVDALITETETDSNLLV